MKYLWTLLLLFFACEKNEGNKEPDKPSSKPEEEIEFKLGQKKQKTWTLAKRVYLMNKESLVDQAMYKSIDLHYTLFCEENICQITEKN